MSIADFTAALRNQAYKNWFAGSKKNIIRQTATQLRDGEQTARKTSFYITRTTVEDVIRYITDAAPTQEDIDTAMRELKAAVGTRKQVVQIPRDNPDTLYFARVSFKSISTILNKGFKHLKNKSNGRKISDKFEKGHVYAIAGNVARQTISNIESSSAIPPETKQALLGVLQELTNKLIESDEATSNIKDPEYYLYAKYKKNPQRYLVELQLKKENQASGRASAPITNAIRRYFTPANVVEFDKNLRTRPEDSFIEDLINSKGSPSFIDLIIADVVSPLTKKKKSSRQFAIPNTKVLPIPAKIDTREVRANIAKERKEVERLKRKVRSLPIKVDNSIVNLESILRDRLVEQVKSNMGRGSSTAVLNLRTGRLAESSRIDRISVSRAGMISIFYDYMKHPYATFSTGGAQQFPKSRDPKALISKSIREIAIPIVGTRLRTVLA